MSQTIRFHSIKCVKEINEASASEEPYVIVTSVDLRPPAIPIGGIPPIFNFEVFRFGVFEDFDAGEVRLGGDPAFWGPSSTPLNIDEPEQVAVIVSLLENDNSTPEQYQTLVRTVVPLALASSAGEPNQAKRAARLTTSIHDTLNGVDLPIPFALDDDHIGTQQLLLEHPDLINSGTKDKVLRINSGQGDYELTFRITAFQPAWRFCGKCMSLFFDGRPEKGRCPVGGGHEAVGLNFALSHDGSPSPDQQADWRFCAKCNELFFDGDPANKGFCPVGGGHEAAGFNFTLTHAAQVPPNHQSDWRFCGKCKSLFFDGDPANKGVCSVGGGHESIGLNFFLPFDSPGDRMQGDWRFCRKCTRLFFDGDPANKGVCSVGGGHESIGLNFFLPFDSPGDRMQGDWRFCGKDLALFFDGEPNKGVCSRPAASSHEPIGFNFSLPNA